MYNNPQVHNQEEYQRYCQHKITVRHKLKIESNTIAKEQKNKVSIPFPALMHI